MDEESSEELPPLRFSQFPGVPPFLNYIVGPGDTPVHPPPILRSLIEQLSPFSVQSNTKSCQKWQSIFGSSS